MSYVQITGANVATDKVLRDGVTEDIQLMKPTDKSALEIFPTANQAWAAGGGAGAAKASAGRFFGYVISAQGAAPMTITDGPAGPVLATIPANAPIGDYMTPVFGGKPFATSLYVNSGAGTAPLTLFYS